MKSYRFLHHKWLFLDKLGLISHEDIYKLRDWDATAGPPTGMLLNQTDFRTRLYPNSTIFIKFIDLSIKMLSDFSVETFFYIFIMVIEEIEDFECTRTLKKILKVC